MKSPSEWTSIQLRIVRGFLTFWLSLVLPPAFAAVVTSSQGWQLVADGVTTPQLSRDACILTGNSLPPPKQQRTWYCREKFVTKVTPTPTPTPVPTPTPTPTPVTGVFADLAKGPAGAPLTVCGTSKISTIAIGGVPATILAHQSANPSLDCARLVPTSAGTIAVNGVGTSLTYTISGGSVLYVSLTGNDATAAKNDPTKPWRYVQGSSEKSGALGAAASGDVLVVRGGEWKDRGLNGKWFRFLTRGDVAVVSYPGEDVHYSGNTGGGVHGPDSGHANQAPNVTLSGLRIDSPSNADSDGAPVNMQYGANGWRLVNLDLSWPGASSSAKAGGLTGHGSNVSVLGVRIHDIGGGQENHGYYIDGGDGQNGPYEIAWNLIEKVAAGNLLQTYDPLDNIGIRQVNVHDNVFRNGGRYGLNLGEGTVSLTARGNLIQNTALAGVRINFTSDSSTNVQVIGNTLTNTNSKGSPSSLAAVSCDSGVKSGTVILGPNVLSGSAKAYSEYGECPAVKLQ